MLSHPPARPPATGQPSPFTVEVSYPDSRTALVTPVGEADACTAPDLAAALADAATVRTHVVVDLDRLSFLDASTLGLLVQARQRLSATGGVLTVRCRTRPGLRLLSVTGLEQLLEPLG